MFGSKVVDEVMPKTLVPKVTSPIAVSPILMVSMPDGSPVTSNCNIMVSDIPPGATLLKVKELFFYQLSILLCNKNHHLDLKK